MFNDRLFFIYANVDQPQITKTSYIANHFLKVVSIFEKPLPNGSLETSSLCFFALEQI